jgi:hypothetical protein
LREVQEWIQSFSHATEQEFLGLGNTVAEAHDLGQRSLQVVADIVAATTGTGTGGPVVAARQALGCAVDLIGTETQRYSAASRGLENALSQLDDLCRLHADLRRTVRHFRHLIICYDIERAHLDPRFQQQIAALTNKMNALQVDASSAYQLQQVRLKGVRDLVAALVPLVTEKLNALCDARERVLFVLAGIQDIPPGILALSNKLPASIQATTNHIAQLVVALQAGDAVRQSLTHVSAVLDDIAARLTELESGGSEFSPGQLRWFVHKACHLAIRQLSEVACKIDSSGENVIHALTATVSQAAEIVDQAVLVASSQAEVSRQRQAMGDLTTALEGLRQRYRDALHIDANILRNAEALSALTERITSISDDMKLVALNAQIHAAKLSQTPALDVLGYRARIMSDANLAIAAGLDQGLAQLQRTVAECASLLDLIARAQADEQESLRQVSQNFAEEITELGERLYADLATVHRECSTLHQRTSDLLRSVRFVSEARIGFGRISRLLTEIAARTQPEADVVSIEPRVRAMLDGFKQKYTMEVERTLHDCVVDQSKTPLPAATNDAVSEFGDNVELF